MNKLFVIVLFVANITALGQTNLFVEAQRDINTNNVSKQSVMEIPIVYEKGKSEKVSFDSSVSQITRFGIDTFGYSIWARGKNRVDTIVISEYPIDKYVHPRLNEGSWTLGFRFTKQF